MKRFATLLLMIISVYVAGQSQDKKALDSSQPPSQPSVQFRQNETFKVIKSKRPQIKDDILTDDIKTIEKAQVEIKAILEKSGLTDADAYQVSLDAWSKVRLRSRLEPDKPMNLNSFIEFVTTSTGLNSIKADKPEVSDAALARDTRIIEQTLPTIRKILVEKGLNETEATSASLFAWKEVRLKSRLSPNQTMNPNSFVEYTTTSVGLVTFISVPDGAEVIVEGTKIGDATVGKWFPIGTIKVLFKMGSKSTERECAVASPSKDCTATIN